MVKPVHRRLHLLLVVLTILNLWLSSCSMVSPEDALAFKTPAIKVKLKSSEHPPPPFLLPSTSPGKGQSTTASQRHPPTAEEVIHEPSTLSLFHLSKASKCCQLTNEPACKLNCIQGMSQLQMFESKCSRGVQEGKETCLEEVELLSIKKQFIASLESKCGQPLTVDSSEQLWMCLLKSGYFGQIEEEQQQPQPALSALANSVIFADLSEASNFDLSFTKPQQQSSIVNASLNPAKWLCCERAHSHNCRQLCYRSLGNEWIDHWAHFTQFCINGVEEGRLRQCLEEGEGKLCVYGCRSGGGLQFCGALFNKPNGVGAPAMDDQQKALVKFNQQHHQFSYYRDCSVEADQAAASTYRRWLSEDVLHYTDQLTLPFRNFSSCQPDLWRLLACSMHLKPCRPDQHTTDICRSNCKILVDECIDTARATEQFDSDAFCDMLTNRLTKAYNPDYSNSEGNEGLSVDDDDIDKTGGGEHTDSSCLDLRQFIVNQHDSKKEAEQNGSNNITGSMSTSSEVELTHNVCKANKCTKEQLCLKNQDCTGENCEPYRCVNACTIGKLRELKVPQETFVSLPAIDAQNVQIIDGVLGQLESCYHLCYCNVAGNLVDCKFYCTNQHPEVVQTRAEEAALAQIECISACPQEYRPVCDNRTSQNYFNACIRDCALHQKQMKANGQKEEISSTVENPNWETDCGRVTDLQRSVNLICPSSVLDQIDKNCTVETGIQLVPIKTELHYITKPVANLAYNREELRALTLESLAVCDSNGEGHANFRSFRRFLSNHSKKNKSKSNNPSFAYFGQCLNYCSLFSPVCGRDGVDYQSECVAHSRHLLVDHFGSCHSSDNGHQSIICPKTRCPSHHYVHYLPLNRCPFCGSVAYFHLAATPFLASISRSADRQLLQNLLLKKGQLTVQILSQQLRQLISVNVCQLYVHQLGKNLVVVLMRPTFNINQVVALKQQTLCELELKRLVMLVRDRSPVVQLLLPLSLLRYNETIALKMGGLMLQEKEKDGARNTGVSLTLLLVCLLYSVTWWNKYNKKLAVI